MSSYVDDESDNDALSFLSRLLQCSCCYQSSSPSNFSSFDNEHHRRRVFATRFQHLLGNIHAQAKAQTQHPRDQVFECVLRLYAHEDTEDIVRRLYTLYDVSNVHVRYYIPQLVNFLYHGSSPSPHRERLELFLLDRAERSLPFAHRLWFFISAYAPSTLYGSELCGPATTVTTTASSQRNLSTLTIASSSTTTGTLPTSSSAATNEFYAPLLRAIEVQGSIAAARAGRLDAAIYPRLRSSDNPIMNNTNTMANTLASSIPSHAAHYSVGSSTSSLFSSPPSIVRHPPYRDHEPINTVQKVAASPGLHDTSVISDTNEDTDDQNPLLKTVPDIITSLQQRSQQQHIDRLQSTAAYLASQPSSSSSSTASSLTVNTSTRAEAAKFIAPPPMSPTLVAALDNRTLAGFYRIRANLLAAASAASHALAANDTTTSSASSNAGPFSTPSTESSIIIPTSSSSSEHTFTLHSSSVAVTPSSLTSSPSQVMKSLGSPTIVNMGPLMPAGGAASSLMFSGGGGLALFRETIDIFLALARISTLITSLPVHQRTSALRASLTAVGTSYLPAKAAYLPLGNMNNRLVALHPEHSFSFKTAKRAPFLVVLEIVDTATTSGLPLDRDDTEDDDEARDRCRKRRERAAELEARNRKEARRARIRQFRERAGTLQGPGGVTAAATAAMDLMSEGVRDAAERVNEAAAEFGEVMQERAGAIASYVRRKVDQITEVPRLHVPAVPLDGSAPVMVGGTNRNGTPLSSPSRSGTLPPPPSDKPTPRALPGVPMAAISSDQFSSTMGNNNKKGKRKKTKGKPSSVTDKERTRLQEKAASKGDYETLSDEAIGTDHPSTVAALDRLKAETVNANGNDANDQNNNDDDDNDSDDDSDNDSIDEETARVLLDGQGGDVGIRLARLLRKVGGGGSGATDQDDLSLETDGLLQTASILGQDLSHKSSEAIKQSLHGQRKALRKMARRMRIIREREVRQSLRDGDTEAQNHGNNSTGDHSFADEADEEQLTTTSRIRRAMKKGTNALVNTVLGEDTDDDDEIIVDHEDETGMSSPGKGHGEYTEVSEGPSSPVLAAIRVSNKNIPPARSNVTNTTGPWNNSKNGSNSIPASLLPSSAPVTSPLSPEEAEQRLQQIGQWGVPADRKVSLPLPVVPTTSTSATTNNTSPLSSVPNSPVPSNRNTTTTSSTVILPHQRHTSAPPTLTASIPDSSRSGKPMYHDHVPIVADAELEKELNEGVPVFSIDGGDNDEIDPDMDPSSSSQNNSSTLIELSHDHASSAVTSSGTVVPVTLNAVHISVPSTTSTDPSTTTVPSTFVVFPERWKEKEASIATTSLYSHLPGWRLVPVIVKANDDLRQEQFVSQLLFQFAAIFRTSRVPVWIKPYDILAISPDAGIIEAIPDTISLDALKRSDPYFTTLDNWFERHFNSGTRGKERVRIARLNFARSLAAYSIVCYILQIKDRHNGNILLDRRGHIMHIDFGFLLSNSPGGNIGFENAPFKLTNEFIEVLGGPNSPLFSTFRKLCVRSFLAVRKHRQRIMLLIQMMLAGNDHLPCFVGGARTVMSSLRTRFYEQGDDRACVTFVHGLIDASMNDWRTRWYDAYQSIAQGVRA